MNVQSGPGKTYFTVNTLPLTQVYSQMVSIRYNNELWKKLVDRVDNEQCKEFRLFVHSVQQTTTRN